MNYRKNFRLIFPIIILTFANTAFTGEKTMIKLPAPRSDSDFSVEKAILQRRSVRDFTGEPLSLKELAQLLWACQGVTSPFGYRSAPSAGALYPLEIYVVVKNVTDLQAGIYHYQPGRKMNEHQIELVQPGDHALALTRAALGQNYIPSAAVNVVIASVTERTAVKYGDRALQYVYLEAGHAAQNICLQAQPFGLGVLTIGAFYDRKVKELLGTDADPVYILCVGRTGR